MTRFQTTTICVVVYFVVVVCPTTSSVSSFWGEWGSWSECSATCGDGSRSRSRTCSPAQGSCPGEATETDTCRKPACCVPHNGQWNYWGSWSSCSRSCGQGTRTRSRACYGPNACGRPCDGDRYQEESCSNHECSAWGAWSSWTCSVTCGRGRESRTRTCTPPEATCSGSSSQTQDCWYPECCVPKHGQWSTWSSWSSCSVSCGKGTRTRSRTCYGTNGCGRPCEGNSATVKPCNDYVCPGSPDMASMTIRNDSKYVYFRCLVATEYAQEFELFKVTSNGKQIRNLISSTNFVNFKLENMQCEDAGIYYCRARKGIKIANSTSVQLNIPCSPRPAGGPLTLPERIKIMEGSKEHYTFAVIAHPVPTIENINYHIEDTVSSLDKEPVRSGFITGDCEQNTPEVTCSLYIANASREDNGLYSVEVRNSKGVMNVTFHLTVIECTDNLTECHRLVSRCGESFMQELCRKSCSGCEQRSDSDAAKLSALEV